MSLSPQRLDEIERNIPNYDGDDRDDVAALVAALRADREQIAGLENLVEVQRDVEGELREQIEQERRVYENLRGDVERLGHFLHDIVQGEPGLDGPVDSAIRLIRDAEHL